MFGLLCGGRPVQTNLQQLEPTKYVFVIIEAAKIHHMAVFLLPGATLPEGSAAAVYAQIPGKDFALLGALTPAKQSAIFRFNTDAVSANAADVDAMEEEDSGTGPKEYDISVGISLEPLAQVEQQLAVIAQQPAAKPKSLMPSTMGRPAAPPAPSDITDIASLANKIVAHAYNYMSSFVDSQGMVPIKAFNDWWNKFKSKLQADPTFLNNIE